MSLKPICFPCRRFYKPEKNDTVFMENKPGTEHAAPGNETPDEWVPYKLWMGDLWKCKGCGSEIIVGTGFDPISEHHMKGFNALVDSHEAYLIQINDC